VARVLFSIFVELHRLMFMVSFLVMVLNLNLCFMADVKYFVSACYDLSIPRHLLLEVTFVPMLSSLVA